MAQAEPIPSTPGTDRSGSATGQGLAPRRPPYALAHPGRRVSAAAVCSAPGADRPGGRIVGVILSYGFGRANESCSDAMLSGKLAWERACRRWRVKTWQCRYVDFDKLDHMRLRPEAPPRPQGFYFAKFRPGAAFLNCTVSRYLKQLPAGDTGCGPEGIQLLTVTHPHLAAMMNRRQTPFMAFADFDVAPHGFNDFYDALQMFCSNETLGLGIGNVDRNYPLFGIPTLRF